MSMLKFFRFPFAIAGDKTSIPDPAQATGSVSYTQGFGPDYEVDPLVDPDGKDVPRDETNQLFFDVTNAIKEYQTFGTPDFITSAMNGGMAFAYGLNARVVWLDGEVYESLINSNTDTPATATSWRKISGVQSNLITVAGGTANALTASFTPSLSALVNGQPLFVRIAAANTSTTPTLNVDGLGAKTIVKGANFALQAGDLAGSGQWAIFQYDATLDKIVLANPALGVYALGVGQTWQDVTGSRALNTDYTNVTGRPIQVNVVLYTINSANTGSLLVGGVTVAKHGAVIGGEPNSNLRTTMSAIVPAGQIYRVNVASGPTLDTWAELR